MRQTANIRKLTASIIGILLLSLILLLGSIPVNAQGWFKSPLTPVLTPGTTGSWDDVGVGAASVIYDTNDNLYKMWYTGYSDDDILKIGYAYSSDGKTNWVKADADGAPVGPVLSPSGADEAAGVGSPCVLKIGGTFYMWYTGYKDVSGNKVPQIFLAESSDGTTWNRQNGGAAVLPQESGIAWENKGVHSASVIYDTSAPHFKMWYTGRSGTTLIGDSSIGYATSDNGVAWTKYVSNPVLSPGGSTFYQQGVAVAQVLKSATGYNMWFSGYNNYHAGDIEVKIGHTSSTDGTSWDAPVLALNKSITGWDVGGVGAPGVLPHGPSNPLEMWYTGVDAGLAPQIGYAATPGATITGTVTLQGDERDLAGMDVPLTMKIYTASVNLGNILTVAPLDTFTTALSDISITNRDVDTKVVTFEVTGVPAGLFNITLYTPHALVNYKAGVNIPYDGATVDMGTLLEGDAQDISEGNTIINITDFGRFASSYNKAEGDEGFDPTADFDESNYIDILDFTLLYTNFLKTSPQTVT
jgi:predicted GH43/DUF377 family glycosyl hydrolase